MKMKILLTLLSVLFFGGVAHAAPPKRILLVPMDDRPPCLQFVEMQARIADVEIVAPPKSLLGRFTAPGKPDEIAAWLKRQDLKTFDAAIISFDMLAYGGLVNSRRFQTPTAQALNNLSVINELKKRAPQLPVYGFSVIMRLALTGDGNTESYREKMARWSEIVPYTASDAKLKTEVEKLEQEIPAAAIADYKQARARNLLINNAAIEMTQRGVLSYLILSQDDAKPRGVHIADRESLAANVKRLKLENIIAIQPGADEVALLLLARALNTQAAFTPRIKAVYSSEKTRNAVAPYEDRKLFETVSFHIRAIGGREVANDSEADALYFVYASRAEPGIAVTFAEKIKRAVDDGKQVIVADIDMKGDVQGADVKFSEELRRHKIFPRLAGYASWNTAGNTIGTALPHGAIYVLATRDFKQLDAAKDARIAAAQTKFTLHRMIDDYAYHGIVRLEAKRFATTRNINPNGMNAEQTKLVEDFTRTKLQPYMKEFVQDFSQDLTVGNNRKGDGVPRAFSVTVNPNFTFSLPWGRTFEALIDFEVEAMESK